MATRAANLVNPNAEIVASSQCLMVNVTAARGLQSVLKTNLGPRGTLKMLVGGAGQIKITKDGNVLLHEMQIQHPTAMMIARAATAMDDQVGDGTTSSVLFTGDLLKQAERYASEGLHPRLITEGYDIAKEMVVDFLEGYKKNFPNIHEDRELLTNVVRTSLKTKLNADLANKMSDAVVNAVLAVRQDHENIDLHMVEIMKMQHKSAADSMYVNGMVLDHGSRHPGMPTRLNKVKILIANVSMEYEKTEQNAGFFLFYG
jgi:T-complex protein 1 subunit zeta